MGQWEEKRIETVIDTVQNRISSLFVFKLNARARVNDAVFFSSNFPIDSQTQLPIFYDFLLRVQKERKQVKTHAHTSRDYMRQFKYLKPKSGRATSDVLSEMLTWDDLPPRKAACVVQCGKSRKYMVFDNFREFSDYILELPAPKRHMNSVVLGPLTPHHVFFDLDCKLDTTKANKKHKVLLIRTLLDCYVRSVYESPSVDELLNTQCWVFDASMSYGSYTKVSIHVHLLGQYVSSRRDWERVLFIMEWLVNSEKWARLYGCLRNDVLDFGASRRRTLRMAGQCKPDDAVRTLKPFLWPRNGGVKPDCPSTLLMCTTLTYVNDGGNTSIASRYEASVPWCRPLSLQCKKRFDMVVPKNFNPVEYDKWFATAVDTVCGPPPVIKPHYYLGDMYVESQPSSKPIIKMGMCLDANGQDEAQFRSSGGGIPASGIRAIKENMRIFAHYVYPDYVRQSVSGALTDNELFYVPRVQSLQTGSDGKIRGWFFSGWPCPTRNVATAARGRRSRSIKPPSCHKTNRTAFVMFVDDDETYHLHAQKMGAKLSVSVFLYCWSPSCRSAASGKATYSSRFPFYFDSPRTTNPFYRN